MQSGIYTIKNIKNGKLYVGSGVCIRSRWNRHRSDLKLGRHLNPKLQAAWNFYGESCFLFSVIEPVEDRSNLIDREQFFIDSLKPEYNCLPKAGSRLGHHVSEATKLKMRSHAKVFRSKTHKECTFCHETKSRDLFDRQSIIGRDPNRPKCKACYKVYNRARWIKLTGNVIRLPSGGDTMSDETKLRLSIARKGVKKGPMSQETKNKLSIAKTGVKRPPFSDEWRNRMRESRLLYLRSVSQ